jgi:5-methylcytosine-specific restriction endonuclease McrA
MPQRRKMRRLSGAMKSMLRQQSLQGRRKTLAKMQGGLCRYCRLKTPWEAGTVDHRIPRARGGSDEMENLVFSCEPCNTEKGTMSEDEYVALRRSRDLLAAD